MTKQRRRGQGARAAHRTRKQRAAALKACRKIARQARGQPAKR